MSITTESSNKTENESSANTKLPDSHSFSQNCSSIINDAVSIVVFVLAAVFPLVFHNSYYDILQTKYYFYRFCILILLFLLALLDDRDPPPKVTVVPAGNSETARLPLELPAEAAVILRGPGEEYPMKNGRTTFYVCRGHSCLPPVNEPPEL